MFEIWNSINNLIAEIEKNWTYKERNVFRKNMTSEQYNFLNNLANVIDEYKKEEDE